MLAGSESNAFRKQPINNKSSGRFTQQSQIGIWSIVTRSHLVEAFWNGFQICTTFLKYQRTHHSQLGFRAKKSAVFVHVSPKQHEHAQGAKKIQQLTSCFIRSCLLAAMLRIMQDSLCSPGSIDLRFVEHECVLQHTPLLQVSIPPAYRSSKESVIRLYYSL